nr:stage III sporulation protein AG [uncultured Mediterraneibacter sp.]
MESKKWKEWIGGLVKREKLPKKNQLLILLLIGILLLVITVPVPSGSEVNDNTDTAVEADIFSSSESGAYEAYLEEKTAEILSQVEGVGEVSVMITLKSGSQKIIEKDQSSSSQTTTESDSSGGTRTVEDTSSDKTSIYSQNEDGSSDPYVSKELTPEIEGVVVIAEGGEDAVVQRNITEAVQALFGVEAHKIKIMKRA